MLERCYVSGKSQNHSAEAGPLPFSLTFLICLENAGALVELFVKCGSVLYVSPPSSHSPTPSSVQTPGDESPRGVPPGDQENTRLAHAKRSVMLSAVASRGLKIASAAIRQAVR